MDIPIRPTAAGVEPTRRIRDLCLALTGVTERASHGEAAWFTGAGKAFVTMADHHHDERVAMWCAAPSGVQEALVEAAPDRFFRPPYYGARGWLGVWLDVPEVDWSEVGALVRDAHATVARRPA